MEKVKVGIVGCGGIANGKHLPSLKKLHNVEFVAFCDIVIEKAKKANQDFADGKALVFEDYHDLINIPEIDAVYVCTPNVSHCEITCAALEKGKHVMCEKPMALNYEEAKKMLQARDKAKKLLTIGYQSRYRSDALYLKKECQNGELGEIYYAKAHAIRRRGVPTWGVFLEEDKQGGGPLIDIGTHALDLALFMMDNYEPLYAVGTTYHKLNNDKNTANIWEHWDPKKFTVEDSAFGFVVMKNGATIVVESSWALNTTDTKEARVSLCGTKAGATMKNDGNLEINGVKNNAQYTLVPNFAAGGVAFYDGVVVNESVKEAQTFINAILNKGELYVLPEQAAVVTKILEGIYISAKTKKPYYFKD